MKKEYVYTIFIYRSEKRLEIFGKDNELISEFYYSNDMEMYNYISVKTKDCKDIDKIKTIQK